MEMGEFRHGSTSILDRRPRLFIPRQTSTTRKLRKTSPQPPFALEMPYLLPGNSRGRCSSSSQLANQIDLVLPVRRVVLPEDLMKPYRRLDQHIRPLPRIPRIVGLRLAGDQPPVYRADVVLL